MLDQEYFRPNVEYMGAQEAYEENLQKVKDLNLSPNNIFDTYLTEKALDVDKVKHSQVLIIVINRSRKASTAKRSRNSSKPRLFTPRRRVRLKALTISERELTAY